MKKINRLLDEDELKDEHLLHLIKKYDIIKFSQEKKFPHNMSVSGAELFKFLTKDKRYIGQNYIFEMEDIYTEIQDCAKKNLDEIKLILFCAITFKQSKLTHDDPYMIYLHLTNQPKGKATPTIKEFKKAMKKSVNTLFEEAEI